MTLAGFKASNHPQQTSKRGAKDEVDDRGTDPAFIASLEERFGRFDLDVAAAPHNAKAPAYYTREQDGLTLPWRGLVWCNPPYSDCGAWVRKAWQEWHSLIETSGAEVKDGPGLRTAIPPHGADDAPDESKPLNIERAASAPSLIAMLLPANRVEQKWWQELVEPYRDRPGSPLRVEFLPGRMRFDRPSAVIGPKGDRPPFGCCLLIWGADA